MKRMYIQPRTIQLAVASRYGLMDNMSYGGTTSGEDNIGWSKPQGNNGGNNGGSTLTIKDVWED